MGNIFSTWLMIAYGLSIIGYLGRLVEGLPRIGILVGMILISSAYGFMFLSKVWVDKKKPSEKEGSKLEDDAKAGVEREATAGVEREATAGAEREAKRWDVKKILTVSGYSLAAMFFFGIHLVPQLTFTVRYYDIFGAIGYGTAAIGSAFLPVLLPIGYAIAALYYVCGSYQKLSQPGWIDRIQLISRTLLAFVYGVTALSYTNM